MTPSVSAAGTGRPSVSVASRARLGVAGPSHTQEAAVILDALCYLVITPRAGGQAGRCRPRCDGMGGGRSSLARGVIAVFIVVVVVFLVIVAAAVAAAVTAAATKGAAVVVVVVVLGGR